MAVSNCCHAPSHVCENREYHRKFTRCYLSENSLVHCTHSIVFRLPLKSWIRIEHVHIPWSDLYVTTVLKMACETHSDGFLYMRKFRIKRAPVVSSSLALLSVYFNLAIDCELSLMREAKERKMQKKAKTYTRFSRLACPPITCDIQVTSNYLSLQNTNCPCLNNGAESPEIHSLVQN